MLLEKKLEEFLKTILLILALIHTDFLSGFYSLVRYQIIKKSSVLSSICFICQ